MSKIFVIAGNREEANGWIKSNLTKRQNDGTTTLSWSDYVIVNDAIKVRGYKDPHGVFIGTWKNRLDLEPIFQNLLLAIDIKSNSHRVVNQMWGEWKSLHTKPTPKKQSALIVFVAGVIQVENVDYVVHDEFIEFANSPAMGLVVSIKTITETMNYVGDGASDSFRWQDPVSNAAAMMARAIDEEVMRTLLTKVNGGVI